MKGEGSKIQIMTKWIITIIDVRLLQDWKGALFALSENVSRGKLWYRRGLFTVNKSPERLPNKFQADDIVLF